MFSLKSFQNYTFKELIFFQIILPKWRLKKITVQGSSVKQRLMITGLVSWVIISTFYIGWKVWTGKCSQGLFLRKGVDLEWVSYTPLHLKSNPLLIPLLHKEWSVPNPIHPLPWSWVWSGVSRSEPVSDKKACSKADFFTNLFNFDF